MEPYQLASEENRRQGEFPITAAKKAGSLALTGATAYAGGKLAGLSFEKIAPFLSKYIPQDLAIKGLNKIDPRFGKFFSKAMSAGKSFDEAKDFISGKMDEETEKEVKGESQAPKENRNIIQKYSPELHEFLSQKIKAGMKPGTIALSLLKGKGNEKFKDVIGKIVKDYKTDWISLVESLYGGGNSEQPQSQAALQPQQPQMQGQPQQSAQQQPGQQQAPMQGGKKEKFIDMLTSYLQQQPPNQ
jgi:hypothetical protein